MILEGLKKMVSIQIHFNDEEGKLVLEKAKEMHLSVSSFGRYFFLTKIAEEDNLKKITN